MAAGLAFDAVGADEAGAPDIASTPEAGGFAVEDGCGWVKDMAVLCVEDMRSGNPVVRTWNVAQEVAVSYGRPRLWLPTARVARRRAAAGVSNEQGEAGEVRLISNLSFIDGNVWAYISQHPSQS
jgi:hypothetical protein